MKSDEMWMMVYEACYEHMRYDEVNDFENICDVMNETMCYVTIDMVDA